MARWILLRGLARESRHWEGFADRLREAFPGDTVLALDLAGNGTRHREASPASVAAMVEDYRRALREAGVAGPVRLLAVSLGGLVALEWARRHPAEIASCVLVNSSLGGLSAFHERLQPRQYGRLLRLACCSSGEAAEALILAMTSAQAGAQLAKKWAAYRRDHPVRLANVLRQLFAALSYRLAEPGPKTPVLLLASRDDRLVDAVCSRHLAARFGWPLAEHPTAGHDLPLDDPQWLLVQVRAWVGKFIHPNGVLLGARFSSPPPAPPTDTRP
jgi:pimeloyl-ACP methyl ester carboxylesterase